MAESGWTPSTAQSSAAASGPTETDALTEIGNCRRPLEASSSRRTNSSRRRRQATGGGQRQVFETAFVSSRPSSTEDLDEVDRIANHPLLMQRHEESPVTTTASTPYMSANEERGRFATRWSAHQLKKSFSTELGNIITADACGGSQAFSSSPPPGSLTGSPDVMASVWGRRRGGLEQAASKRGKSVERLLCSSTRMTGSQPQQRFRFRQGRRHHHAFMQTHLQDDYESVGSGVHSMPASSHGDDVGNDGSSLGDSPLPSTGVSQERRNCRQAAVADTEQPSTLISRRDDQLAGQTSNDDLSSSSRRSSSSNLGSSRGIPSARQWRERLLLSTAGRIRPHDEEPRHHHQKRRKNKLMMADTGLRSAGTSPVSSSWLFPFRPREALSRLVRSAKANRSCDNILHDDLQQPQVNNQSENPNTRLTSSMSVGNILLQSEVVESESASGYAVTSPQSVTGSGVGDLAARHKLLISPRGGNSVVRNSSTANAYKSERGGGKTSGDSLPPDYSPRTGCVRDLTSNNPSAAGRPSDRSSHFVGQRESEQHPSRAARPSLVQRQLGARSKSSLDDMTWQRRRRSLLGKAGGEPKPTILSGTSADHQTCENPTMSASWSPALSSTSSVAGGRDFSGGLDELPVRRFGVNYRSGSSSATSSPMLGGAELGQLSLKISCLPDDSYDTSASRTGSPAFSPATSWRYQRVSRPTAVSGRGSLRSRAADCPADISSRESSPMWTPPTRHATHLSMMRRVSGRDSAGSVSRADSPIISDMVTGYQSSIAAESFLTPTRPHRDVSPQVSGWQARKSLRHFISPPEYLTPSLRPTFPESSGRRASETEAMEDAKTGSREKLLTTRKVFLPPSRSPTQSCGEEEEYDAPHLSLDSDKFSSLADDEGKTAITTALVHQEDKLDMALPVDPRCSGDGVILSGCLSSPHAGGMGRRAPGRYGSSTSSGFSTMGSPASGIETRLRSSRLPTPPNTAPSVKKRLPPASADGRISTSSTLLSTADMLSDIQSVDSILQTSEVDAAKDKLGAEATQRCLGDSAVSGERSAGGCILTRGKRTSSWGRHRHRLFHHLPRSPASRGQAGKADKTGRGGDKLTSSTESTPQHQASSSSTPTRDSGGPGGTGHQSAGHARPTRLRCRQRVEQLLQHQRAGRHSSESSSCLSSWESLESSASSQGYYSEGSSCIQAGSESNSNCNSIGRNYSMNNYTLILNTSNNNINNNVSSSAAHNSLNNKNNNLPGSRLRRIVPASLNILSPISDKSGGDQISPSSSLLAPSDCPSDEATAAVTMGGQKRPTVGGAITSVETGHAAAPTPLRSGGSADDLDNSTTAAWTNDNANKTNNNINNNFGNNNNGQQQGQAATTEPGAPAGGKNHKKRRNLNLNLNFNQSGGGGTSGKSHQQLHQLRTPDLVQYLNVPWEMPKLRKRIAARKSAAKFCFSSQASSPEMSPDKETLPKSPDVELLLSYPGGKDKAQGLPPGQLQQEHGTACSQLRQGPCTTSSQPGQGVIRQGLWTSTCQIPQGQHGLSSSQQHRQGACLISSQLQQGQYLASSGQLQSDQPMNFVSRFTGSNAADSASCSNVADEEDNIPLGGDAVTKMSVSDEFPGLALHGVAHKAGTDLEAKNNNRGGARGLPETGSDGVAANARVASDSGLSMSSQEVKDILDVPWSMPKLRRNWSSTAVSSTSSSPLPTSRPRPKLDLNLNSRSASASNSPLVLRLNRSAADPGRLPLVAAKLSRIAEPEAGSACPSVPDNNLREADSLGESVGGRPQKQSQIGDLGEILPFHMPKLQRRLRSQLIASQDEIIENTASDSEVNSEVSGRPPRPLSLQPSRATSLRLNNPTSRKEKPKLTLSLAGLSSYNLDEGQHGGDRPQHLSLHQVLSLSQSVDVDTSIPLERQDWYHGRLNKTEAENVLRARAEGSYLVRALASAEAGDHYYLAIKSARGFIHLKIRRRTEDAPTEAAEEMREDERGNFVLGDASKGFDSVVELVRHYSINRLPIKGAEHLCLLTPAVEELL